MTELAYTRHDFIAITQGIKEVLDASVSVCNVIKESAIHGNTIFLGPIPMT